MKKKGIIALTLVGVMCLSILGGCGSSDDSSSSGDTIKIGYVNPTTGSLAGNGEGVDWIVDQIETYVNDELGGIEVDGETKDIEVIVYDSESDSTTCTEMAQKLVEEDDVDMLIAIQTPETVIPVAAVAERYGVPCVAIQAPVDPVAEAADSYEWTFEAFWTIENVYEQYKALWTAAGYPEGSGASVGIAFANDADGTAWYSVFTENLEDDGYVMVDPGQYPSGTSDFSSVVSTFKDADIDILAGTNIPADFSNLYSQMISAGVEVDAVTMGKCCLLEGDIESLGDLGEGIMTEVWWAPSYPYVSELTGMSCSEIGEAYSADNDDREMPQPAGYGYAALEIAVNAFIEAGSTDAEDVRDALAATDITTIVGPIAYDSEMGGLTYCETVLSGGQWQLNDDGDLELVIIDNSLYSDIETTGSYVEGNATQD